MILPTTTSRYTCARCQRTDSSVWRLNLTRITATPGWRRYGNAATQRQDPHNISENVRNSKGEDLTKEAEDGVLTRRLRDMTEEALESSGNSALKAIKEAGFSPDLKAQIEQRIAAANLRPSQIDIPAAASRHSQDIATSEPWAGTESIHDASLRMLNDAHKPMRLRRPPRAPGVQMPKSIDTGRNRNKEARGTRLANARDRSGLYASLKDDSDLETADREKRLQELKDRFDPHARVIVPGSIQGLASLANKRIEDAIARGQFRNLPRGKGKNVERDYNASSPFIDTTEYFMNKIIQKQEIVPPWIEKQQELTAAANKFRSRLRADWKRHAARMISSKGGSLLDQVRKAEAYAQAEIVNSPSRRKVEVPMVVDDDGNMSQISLSGQLAVKSEPEQTPDASSASSEEVTTEKKTFDATTPAVAEHTTTAVEQIAQSISVPLNAPRTSVSPAPFPFRDPDWEHIESAYLRAAIKDLNDKARTYNLQAPDLAKKPYFNLERELSTCYADVAPLLAEAIIDRARAPAKRVESITLAPGEKSILDNLVGGPVRVMDERTSKQYGFKQFWKDLWTTKPKPEY